MQSNEQRRVIWRHPRGIYETVEVSGTGVFGIPYNYRETIYTADRDARGVAHKEDKPESVSRERIPLSAKDEREICKMYEADLSPIAYIAAYMHRTPATIKEILAKHSIPVRRSGPRSKNR